MDQPALAHRVSCLCSCLMVLGLATSAAARPADAAAPDMVAVGKQIATHLNERQTDALAAMYDMDALAARVAANVYDDEVERKAFVRGFTKSSPGSTVAKEHMTKLDRSPDTVVKFMKVVVRGRESRPLLRFDWGDSGFDYVEYVVRPDAEGRPRIVDWASLSMGALYSESISWMVRVFADPSPGLVKTLLGMPQLDQATMTRLRTIGELRRKGDYGGAAKEMAKLPPALADSRVMLSQRVSLASSGDDDHAYLKALARLEQLHGSDPATAYLLLDHYFETGDIEKCFQVIAVIEGWIGADGMTQLLRASILATVGRRAEVVDYSRKAIELEPDLEAAYFLLAQSLVELGRFDEAIEAYTTLQQDFGYEFTKERFAQDATYAKFIASPQFKRWLR